MAAMPVLNRMLLVSSVTCTTKPVVCCHTTGLQTSTKDACCDSLQYSITFERNLTFWEESPHTVAASLVAKPHAQAAFVQQVPF